jgi:hypothetical protein
LKYVKQHCHKNVGFIAQGAPKKLHTKGKKTYHQPYERVMKNRSKMKNRERESRREFTEIDGGLLRNHLGQQGDAK